jgi:hypothetical protein
MSLARVLVAAAITVSLPALVQGAIFTSHIASDAELVAMLSDTMFVAEGRIGDRGGAATFELDLGQDTAAPFTAAQYDWQSGTVEPFSLTYDAVTSLVTFTLGGVTLQYTTSWFDFDQVFVRTRAVNEGSSVAVSDIVIDGESVMDQSQAIGNGSDILWIRGAMLDNGFTLAGNAVLSWTGAAPTQSRLAFQVKIGKLGIVSTEESSWSGIKNISGGS